MTPHRSPFGRRMLAENAYARALDVAYRRLREALERGEVVYDKVDFLVRATPGPDELARIEGRA